jgi:hypothetical protein
LPNYWSDGRWQTSNEHKRVRLKTCITFCIKSVKRPTFNKKSFSFNFLHRTRISENASKITIGECMPSWYNLQDEQTFSKTIGSDEQE